MKILFIVSSMSYGGAERVVSILSRELVGRGYQVGICATSGKKAAVYPLSREVSFSCIGNDDSVGALRFAFRTVRGIRRYVKESKPDVVIAFMTWQIIYTTLALFGKKVPLIISERNDPATIDGKPGNTLLFRLRDFCYERADGAVFQTEGAARCFSDKLRKKSCVIANPLDTERLPLPYTGKRDDRIVSVGRLSKQKNQALLLRAFSLFHTEFPSCRLCFYGSGNLLAELEKLADDLEIRGKVDFCGNTADVPNAILTARLFAFSSDYEGLPNALAEAMALGLPCVSTDCSPGGAAALIRDGENGRLVPCGDVDAFAAAMRQMLTDTDASEVMGKAATEVREKYRSEDIIGQWMSFIDKYGK